MSELAVRGVLLVLVVVLVVVLAVACWAVNDP